MWLYVEIRKANRMDTTVGERTEHLLVARRPYPWLRVPVAFLIHQFLATWGLFMAVPMVLMFLVELGLHLGVKVYMTQIDWILYGTPFFPLHVVMALIVGWVLGGTLEERSMLWVWVLPFLSLCTSRVGFPLIARAYSESYR